MIQVNESGCIYYEIKDSYDLQTYIGLSTTKDFISFNYEGIVLKENFAISYPYVFKWEGKYYMIPETYLTNSIRLYKAQEFINGCPSNWALEDILITGKSFVDASIFRYNGKWWIFASTPQNKDLYLYYADDLNSTWIEHPMSPVIENDRNYARPGGRIVEYEGNLYRFAQDDDPYYGNQVWAFKIIKLTETEYQEELVPKPAITKGNLGWNNKGMHNIDPHQLNENEWIACVDGYKMSIVVEK